MINKNKTLGLGLIIYPKRILKSLIFQMYEMNKDIFALLEVRNSSMKVFVQNRERKSVKSLQKDGEIGQRY